MIPLIKGEGSADGGDDGAGDGVGVVERGLVQESWGVAEGEAVDVGELGREVVVGARLGLWRGYEGFDAESGGREWFAY